MLEPIRSDGWRLFGVQGVLRRAWIEIVVLALVGFLVWAYFAQAPESLSSQASGGTPIPALMAAFELPISKIDFDREKVVAGRRVIVLLVPESKTPVSPAPAGDDVRFEGVIFANVLDASGYALKPPYPAAMTIRVLVPRGSQDETTIKFASRLANVSRIVVLPAP